MALRRWKVATGAVICALGLVALSGGGAVAATKVTVSTATVPGVGTVLVDASGHTLYTLTDANGTAVACTGTCAGAWPPLTVAAGAKVKGSKGVKSLGSTSDTHQVTSGSFPLYRFAGDTAAKQARGEGISSFGGTWHVVKVKNVKPTSSTGSNKTNAGTGGNGF
jgi:predicted lipoprotein with Yx(FWY)xxD motif